MTGMAAARFRSRFPMLERTVHLAGCSLGARSVELDGALHGMLDDMAAGGAPWELFEQQVALARKGFAALIGTDEAHVAIVPNASVGAYQVASTMDWTARPKIVTATAEFPSIAHVWLAQRPRGAEVVQVDAADYDAAIDDRTRLVSVPMTTYARAVRIPVATVAAIARDRGAQVFVDAYQAVGVEPVDVTALGCDYLVAGTMKYLLGLPGLSFLYARSPADTDRVPSLTGWFGRTDPFAFDPRTLDFPSAAARFETGTPAIAACYAANAGLGLINALDLGAVRAHVLAMTELAVARLTEQGERVLELPPAERGAHVCLVDADPGALSRFLAEKSIAVSKRGSVIRLAFHYYSNGDDVAALCAAIKDYRVDRGLRAHHPIPSRAAGDHVHS